MKFIILAGLFSINAFAACPSIDDVISKANGGRATTLDVENAILCKVSICGLKIAILTDVVVQTVDRFNVGETTTTEITEAAQNLAKAKGECSK